MIRRRLSIGTRFGVLDSFDGGRTWAQRHCTLPVTRANLFRLGDATFFSAIGNSFARPSDEASWQPISGLVTAATHGTRVGERVDSEK